MSAFLQRIADRVLERAPVVQPPLPTAPAARPPAGAVLAGDTAGDHGPVRWDPAAAVRAAAVPAALAAAAAPPGAVAPAAAPPVAAALRGTAAPAAAPPVAAALR